MKKKILKSEFVRVNLKSTLPKSESLNIRVNLKKKILKSEFVRVNLKSTLPKSESLTK